MQSPYRTRTGLSYSRSFISSSSSDLSHSQSTSSSSSITAPDSPSSDAEIPDPYTEIEPIGCPDLTINNSDSESSESDITLDQETEQHSEDQTAVDHQTTASHSHSFDEEFPLTPNLLSFISGPLPQIETNLATIKTIQTSTSTSLSVTSKSLGEHLHYCIFKASVSETNSSKEQIIKTKKIYTLRADCKCKIILLGIQQNRNRTQFNYRVRCLTTWNGLYNAETNIDKNNFNRIFELTPKQPKSEQELIHILLAGITVSTISNPLEENQNISIQTQQQPQQQQQSQQQSQKQQHSITRCLYNITPTPSTSSHARTTFSSSTCLSTSTTPIIYPPLIPALEKYNGESQGDRL